MAKKKPRKRSDGKARADAAKLTPEELFAKLKLRHIRLIELSTSVHITGGRFPDGAQITAKTGMGPTPDGKNLNVDVTLDVEAKPKGLEEDCSLLLVKAKYQCVFDISEFTFDSLVHLAGPICDLGARVAWPYVRELVQSITARMGIPPVILPILVHQHGAMVEAGKKSP